MFVMYLVKHKDFTFTVRQYNENAMKIYWVSGQLHAPAASPPEK